MPMESQAQRGFMRMCNTPAGRAKAQGKCPPQAVAKKFVAHDQGGKLPAHAGGRASSAKTTARRYGF